MTGREGVSISKHPQTTKAPLILFFFLLGGEEKERHQGPDKTTPHRLKTKGPKRVFENPEEPVTKKVGGEGERGSRLERQLDSKRMFPPSCPRVGGGGVRARFHPIE